MTREVVVYRRDDIYAEIWKEPATTVAKRYSVSSTALSKICKTLNIPTPSRGYWARRTVGVVEATPQLPEDGPAELKVVRNARHLDRKRVAHSLAEGRAASAVPIVVGATLERQHPWILMSQSAFASGQLHHGMVCPTAASVDVVVSPAQLERALGIMNAILFALDDRGLPTEIAIEPRKRTQPEAAVGSITRVSINGEWIRFGIMEQLREYEPIATSPPKGLKGDDLKWWTYINRPRVQLVPCGTLVLQIKHKHAGVRVSWRDAKRKVERHLNAFVQQLFVVGDALKQRNEASQQWVATTEAADAEKRARREQAEREARKLSELREHLSRWREAQDLKRFIEELRTSAGAPTSILLLAEAHLTRLHGEFIPQPTTRGAP